jgi:hypothetical protein
MQRRWIPVALAGVMTVAATAVAAESREAREREARQACFTGNVDRGVEILVDLYVETQHPNYIYNQARCFERNGKHDQALLSYEDYLRKASNLGEAERAQVEKSIAELRAKVSPPPPPPPDAGPSAGPRPVTPPLDAAPAPPPVKPSDAVPVPPAGGDKAPATDGSWQRTTGTVALIVAGGGLVLGVAGHVLRQARAADFNDDCTYFGGEPVPAIIGSGADCRGKYDAVKGAERMMWIGYVAGGAFAVAGATLLLLAPRKADTGAMAWARACTPTVVGTAGVACGWSF